MKPRFLRTDQSGPYLSVDDRILRVLKAKKARDCIAVFVNEFQSYGGIGSEFYSVIVFPMEGGIGDRKIPQWEEGMMIGTSFDSEYVDDLYRSIFTDENEDFMPCIKDLAPRKFRPEGALE